MTRAATAIYVLLVISMACKSDSDSDNTGEKDDDSARSRLEQGGTMADAGATEAPACSERSLGDCESMDEACVVVEGRQINEDERCFGELEGAACTSADISGGGAMPECLIDPDGIAWWFAQGVTVVGWVEESSADCSMLERCPSL